MRGGRETTVLTTDQVRDLLYHGFQGLFLERGVREFEPLEFREDAPTVDARSIVIARAMRHAASGRGDLCSPGPLSVGPALAFGATPLEFLRHLARKATASAAARTGGLTWTDLRRGLIGWNGPPGMMTQVLAGAAFAFAHRREDRVALVFEKEAALDTGGWHEGVNFAAAKKVPLIVVIESTSSGPANSRALLDDVGRAYGVAALTVAGESHYSLFLTVTATRRRAVSGEGPTLIGLQAVPERGRWKSHEQFEDWALAEGRIERGELRSIRTAAAAAVDHALRRIAKEPVPEPHDALAAVRTGSPPSRPWTRLKPPSPAGGHGAIAGGTDVH